jgi:hypothetical protein
VGAQAGEDLWWRRRPHAGGRHGLQQVLQVVAGRAMHAQQARCGLQRGGQRAQPIELCRRQRGGGVAVACRHALRTEREQLAFVVACERGPVARHQPSGGFARPQRAGDDVAQVQEGVGIARVGHHRFQCEQIAVNIGHDGPAARAGCGCRHCDEALTITRFRSCG